MSLPPGADITTTLEHLRGSDALRGVGPATLAALAAAVETCVLAPDEALFATPEQRDALYLVLQGELRACETGNPEAVDAVRTIGPGEGLDEMLLVAGGARGLEVRAAGDAVVARIPGAVLHDLAAGDEQVAAARQRLHRRQLLCRLHPLFGTFSGRLLDDLETAAAWTALPRGDLLFEQNDPGDGMYFVVSGRLRAERTERDGTRRVVSTAGRGESIGEMAFFTHEPRSARVFAVRDSVLVALSHAAFETLVAAHPHLLRRVTRSLLQRVNRPGGTRTGGEVVNVAVIGAGNGVDVEAFTTRLVDALAAFGPTLRLSAGETDRRMGQAGISAADEGDDDRARLLAWLEAQEAAHRFVVYQAEAGPSPWTHRCLRQADRVLLVAPADGAPEPGAEEAAILADDGGAARARRLLLLVHAEDAPLPSGTRRWLDARRVDEHHHLRGTGPKAMARLARVLAGRAAGLVLGGGGARGLAHIGVLQALQEDGLEIDMVGGTSFGASIAAQHAMGWSAEQIRETNRRVWVQIRPHQRYTLPVLSIIGAAEAKVCGDMMYGTTQIEDLWIPFFCVSSDLATAEMVVHRTGSVLWAATASASLPGAALPVLLDGHLLVDGALFNNVPTDVMRDLGAGWIAASEVTVEEDRAFICERIPTPQAVLWARLRGRPETVPFPSLMEVALRASMLNSIARERGNLALADLCFRPPIESFRLMDFSRLDELVAVGHEHARGVLRAHREAAAPDAPPSSTAAS